MQTVEKLQRPKCPGVRVGPTSHVPSFTAAVRYYKVAIFWKWLTIVEISLSQGGIITTAQEPGSHSRQNMSFPVEESSKYMFARDEGVR